MGLFSKKKKEFVKPEVLIEDKSHSCPITAVVEQDNRVAYFYLWGENEQYGVKSCWIRNLSEAPEKREGKLLKKGVPPMMPATFCRFPNGQDKLKKENLKVVWLEEGDGAALLENDEIIAIIPSWSGHGGFYGYARDCIGSGDFAWELGDKNEMPDRIQKSSEFIDLWDKELNPFQELQPRILKNYEELFGKSDRYFTIDNNEWPPKGLYLQDGANKTIFATVAVSLRPQPAVEMYTENRNDINRIELGLILNSDLSEQQINEIASWISGQASLPWNNITFLGEGHTINFEIFKSSKMDSVVLTNKLDVLPKVNLTDYRDSKINFLWMVPISSKERDKIMNEGSENVLIELNKIGDEIFNLERTEIE